MCTHVKSTLTFCFGFLRFISQIFLTNQTENGQINQSSLALKCCFFVFVFFCLFVLFLFLFFVFLAHRVSSYFDLSKYFLIQSMLTKTCMYRSFFVCLFVFCLFCFLFSFVLFSGGGGGSCLFSPHFFLSFLFLYARQYTSHP